MPLMNQGSLCPFSPSWELWKYYTVSDWFKKEKEILESSRLEFVEKCQKSGEPCFWEVMDSFVLVGYTSLAVSITFFATITSLSELYFRFKRFILLVQMN